MTPPPADAQDLSRDDLDDLVETVARSRDRAAFDTLFRFFVPRIRAYLLRLRASNGEADEIAQEVMITLWRKAEQFDRRQASASTWIYTIARNRRIDTIRRAKRPEFDPDDPLFVPDPEPAPDAALQTADREDRVRAALKTLPPEQADLVRAAFVEGKSHRELAEATGLPLGTVKSRLRLAFGRLRKSLEDER